jgi:hypothetical protein
MVARQPEAGGFPQIRGLSTGREVAFGREGCYSRKVATGGYEFRRVELAIEGSVCYSWKVAARSNAASRWPSGLPDEGSGKQGNGSSSFGSGEAGVFQVRAPGSAVGNP